MLSQSFVSHHHILLLEDDNGPRLLITSKTDVGAIAEVNRILSDIPTIEFVSEKQFDDIKVGQYHEAGTNTLSKGIEAESSLLDAVGEIASVADISFNESQSEIVTFVSAALSEAVKLEASDIAFESYETKMVVRVSVDGVHRQITEVPRGAAAAIISRLKIMFNLDIAIKKTTQDGGLTLNVSGKKMDARIATIPSIYGERVSIRLLQTNKDLRGLENLELTEQELNDIHELVTCPSGIVFITGPTESGKTTTLYAALKKLNTPDINIMTVEDPVEYRLEGVTQISVSEATGFTFPVILRGLVRQNPDVLLVGEVRDDETANIAIQSSLTGHLTLATLHANSGAGAISRLNKMNIERFLIASTLKGVVSQRLIRKLCPSCKRAAETTQEIRAVLGKNVSHHYQSVGCPDCNGTGFKGRVGIYEIIKIDSVLAKMIQDNAGQSDIERYALKEGVSLFDKGVQKVIDGITSLDELYKTVRSNKESHDAGL